ncbi:unnamed protein product, partial [Thelazia callipaeda]|uniref:EGF-like domain-containing protein n=1 Tax=Thelazia callipaeda TaxID=103827 RepID=A0A0N5D5R1_THECL
CLPWQFDCQFGSPRCISHYKVNDGAIDCSSGFDEGCPPHNFVCADKSACIDFSQYQDGVAHCEDKSDEPCAAGDFLCNDHSQCIEGKRFQDGVADCKDGSDEECTVTQFECNCGKIQCVDGEKLKDGRKDCEDGSDETPPSVETHCPDGQPVRAKRARNRTVLYPTYNAITKCPDPSVCSERLGEICIMVGGATHCVCKKGTVRPHGSPRCVLEALLQQYLNNIIGNCTEIQKDLIEVYGKKVEFSTSARNTHARRQHECDPSANTPCKGYGEVCQFDSANQYRCTCANNATRMNGVCLVNECASAQLNDCDANASCMDSPTSYECFCNEGYIDMSTSPKTRPGIKCAKLVNECASSTTNECDKNADCIDKPIGYTCRCRDGFVDISKGGARNPGRKCHKCIALINECQEGLSDCDPKAKCIDMTSGYTCKCPHGFTDLSPNPTSKPGRICSQLNNTCDSPNFTGCKSNTSKCMGTKDGFVCRCVDGYLDLNPASPGTNCSKSGILRLKFDNT